MKYATLFGILLILLVACSPSAVEESDTEILEEVETPEEPEVETAPVEPVESEDAVDVEEETPPEELEIVKVPAEPVLSTTSVEETIAVYNHIEKILEAAQERTRLYSYLDTFAQDVSSYSFVYGQDKYYSKGTRYKIILADPDIERNVEAGDRNILVFYYDTIYLDRGSQAAVAFCEGHKSSTNQQCESLKLADIPLPVNYNEYAIRLPEEWLIQYLDTEPVLVDKNKNYIKGRISTFARIENGTHNIDMNLDEKIGLPIRVDIKTGNVLIKRHDYEDMVSNKVGDVDLIHRSKSEIPSDEVFYT